MIELIEKDIIRKTLLEVGAYVFSEIDARAQKARKKGLKPESVEDITPEDAAFLEGAALAGVVISAIADSLDDEEDDERSEDK